MKYENATVCYDDESLKKQADQKYLEFIIQLEKLKNFIKFKYERKN